MKYHLYKRTYETGTIWWYWYTENGKRVRKSTGEKLRRKAEQYVDSLRQIEHTGKSLGTYSIPFFTEQCPYLRHKNLKPITIQKHQDNLKKITEQFGTTLLKDIIPREIEDWLYSLSLANSTKNEILGTLQIILTEAARDREIPGVPIFRKLTRDSRRYDILSDKELETLFPEDPQELISVWKVNYDTPRNALMFGTLFALSVSAGLRPGEARAIRRENLYLEGKAISITGQIDKAGNLTNPKKSTDKNLKHRVALLPDRTINMVKYWLNFDNPQDFIFHTQGDPLRAEYVQGRFRKTLKRLGISGERKLSPHSLRYTYNTKMEMYLGGSVLRQIMGHSTESMTNHYSNPRIDQRIKELESINVNQFWVQSQ
jgi:integrase